MDSIINSITIQYGFVGLYVLGSFVVIRTLYKMWQKADDSSRTFAERAIKAIESNTGAWTAASASNSDLVRTNAVLIRLMERELERVRS